MSADEHASRWLEDDEQWLLDCGQGDLSPIKLSASCFYQKSDGSKAESRIVGVGTQAAPHDQLHSAAGSVIESDKLTQYSGPTPVPALSRFV